MCEMHVVVVEVLVVKLAADCLNGRLVLKFKQLNSAMDLRLRLKF